MAVLKANDLRRWHALLQVLSVEAQKLMRKMIMDRAGPAVAGRLLARTVHQ